MGNESSSLLKKKRRKKKDFSEVESRDKKGEGAGCGISRPLPPRLFCLFVLVLVIAYTKECHCGKISKKIYEKKTAFSAFLCIPNF